MSCIEARATGLLALALTMVAAMHDAGAQTPRCQALSSEQQRAKQSLFAALHPYEGCDETFDRCLAATPPSPVVLRLANDICRHVKEGKSRQEIERALSKRAQSMLPTLAPASFALDDSTLVGDPRAPVRVVVYACARCPFCRVLVLALHKEVTEGALQGKVQLYFRPFPLRDHRGSVEGGLAMISAARLGQFWPFVVTLYQRYDAFCPQGLRQWAVEAGMDPAAFDREVASPQTREALVASKQEGIRNRVDATPAIFIDGRRYVYEMKDEVIVDVLLEAYETAVAARKTP